MCRGVQEEQFDMKRFEITWLNFEISQREVEGMKMWRRKNEEREGALKEMKFQPLIWLFIVMIFLGQNDSFAPSLIL